MGARLKVTILRWKSKSIESTLDKRRQKARLERKEQQIQRLKAELARLKEVTQPQRVGHHTYPAQLIAMAVFIVVHAGGSLRCAAKTVGFLSRMMGWTYESPSHSTVRNWVLRCGLYRLEYGVEKVGSYVGIIDERIQIGREKLLLFLGVKLHDDRSHCAALTLADVEVLGMEVQQSWNGDEVAEFIERRLNHHAKINLKYVISDRGTALLAALRKLSLATVSDCSHLMMNIVKKLFSTNEQLSVLCTQVGQLRRQLSLTDQGFLLPSTLRDKDRFLRVFTLVQWADRINAYWEKLPQKSRQSLQFLNQAQPLLHGMRQVRDLIVMTSHLLKSAGLSTVSCQKWEARIAQYTQSNTLTVETQLFIQGVRNYFIQHDQLMNQHQHLLCCSDIIESTFGRYKNKGGTNVISADVLSIALYGQELTTDFIRSALAKTHQKDLDDWHQRYTCDNRYSILRRMDRELKTVA